MVTKNLLFISLSVLLILASVIGLTIPIRIALGVHSVLILATIIGGCPKTAPFLISVRRR